MELMRHHVEDIKTLSDTGYNASLLATAVVWKLAESHSEYNLDNPENFIAMKIAYEKAIKAYRNNNIQVMGKDVRPDILCINCAISPALCDMRLEVYLSRILTRRKNWAKNGLWSESAQIK